MKDSICTDQHFPGLIEWSTQYNALTSIAYVKEMVGQRLKSLIMLNMQWKFLSTVNFCISIKYSNMGDSSLLSDFVADDLVRKTLNDNKRVLICKQLLNGEMVTIPVNYGCFMFKGSFHDLQTGKEIGQDKVIKNERSHLIQKANHRASQNVK